METGKKIIVFDGVCNLCNQSVQFILKHDMNDTFRFTALQGEIGQRLLLERTIDISKVDSIILIEPGVAYYVKSDAALKIGMHLKGYRTISKVLNLIPSTLRDIVYDFVARNRYSWFGKKEQCMIPSPEVKARFLDA